MGGGGPVVDAGGPVVDDWQVTSRIMSTANAHCRVGHGQSSNIRLAWSPFQLSTDGPRLHQPTLY